MAAQQVQFYFKREATKVQRSGLQSRERHLPPPVSGYFCFITLPLRDHNFNKVVELSKSWELVTPTHTWTTFIHSIYSKKKLCNNFLLYDPHLPGTMATKLEEILWRSQCSGEGNLRVTTETIPDDKVTCTNCYQSCASHQDGRSPERETLPPLEGPGGGGGRVPGTILSNPWGWAQPLRSRTHENLKGDQKRFRDKGLGGGGSESAVGGHFFLGSTQWLSSRVCIRDTIMEGGG